MWFEKGKVTASSSGILFVKMLPIRANSFWDRGFLGSLDRCLKYQVHGHSESVTGRFPLCCHVMLLLKVAFPSSLCLSWILSASPDGLTSICFPNISFWCIWCTLRRAVPGIPLAWHGPCQRSVVEAAAVIHRQCQIIRGFCKKFQLFLC